MHLFFDAKYYEIIKKLNSSRLPPKTKADSLTIIETHKAEIEELIKQIQSHHTNSPPESIQLFVEEIYTNVLSHFNSFFDNLNLENLTSTDSILNALDNLQRPLIFRAVLINDVNLVKFQCANGADVLAQDKSMHDNTPLLWAIANSSIQAACALLDNSVVTCTDKMLKQINQTDAKKATPLILSISKGYTHTNNNNKKGQHAYYQGQIIDKLLELGANVNLQDAKGFSALHYACLHQNLELITSLLRHGANPFLVNLNGETPLALLNKSRGERSTLLKSACAIFTLELDDPVNKKEIAALLKSQMFKMTTDNIPPRLPVESQYIGHPLKTPAQAITTRMRNYPKQHSTYPTKPRARPRTHTSLGAPISSKEKSNVVVQKNNTTFLMRFFVSPLTRSAFVLLVLSAAVLGLMASGFLVGLGPIISSSALLLTSVGLFAGGGSQVLSQTDTKTMINNH